MKHKRPPVISNPRSAMHTEDSAMRTIYSLALSLLVFSAPVFAFGGCVDSPENPTWILGLLGGAAAATPWLHGKLSEWKRCRGD